MEDAQIAALFEACRRNDVPAVQQLCAQQPDMLAAQDAKGYSPLLIAVYNNAQDVALFLLQQGAPADMPDASGNTALMGAAFKGYGNMVRAMLDAGVDVNGRNGSGATALTFAATFGHLQVAEDLLERGALLDLPDSRGKTPIDHAVIQENEPMVRLLERYEQMRMSGQSMLGDN